MGFNEAVSSGLRQFFRLRGWATRTEYFYFLLFFVLLQVCAKVIKTLAFFTYRSAMDYFESVDGLASAFGVALLVACTQAHQAVATLVLAVVGLGMFAVPLAVFVFTLMPGDRSYNKYDYV